MPKPESKLNGYNFSNNIVRLLFIGLVAGFIFIIFNGITELYMAFFVSFLTAFLLNPAVNFIESFGLPRLLGVFLIIISLVFLIFVFIQFIFPVLNDEISKLLIEDNLMKTEAELQKLVLSTHQYLAHSLPAETLEKINYPFLKQKLQGFGKSLLPHDLAVLGDMLTFILITPIITTVLLLQGDSIYKKVLGMVPNRYFEMVILLTDKIKTQIRLYLKGLSLQWLIFTTVFSVTLWLADVPFAFGLAIFAATFNIIPYVGPIIGMIPALVVVLVSPQISLGVVIMAILVTQLIDNAFTQPVVLAGSVKLHPLIAILTLITLQQYLGIIGMVIAIPLASIVMASIEIMYKQMKAFGVI